MNKTVLDDPFMYINFWHLLLMKRNDKKFSISLNFWSFELLISKNLIKIPWSSNDQDSPVFMSAWVTSLFPDHAVGNYRIFQFIHVYIHLRVMTILVWCWYIFFVDRGNDNWLIKYEPATSTPKGDSEVQALSKIYMQCENDEIQYSAKISTFIS